MLNSIAQSKTTLIAGLAILSFAAPAYSSTPAQVSQSPGTSNAHRQMQVCSDQAVEGYVSKLGSSQLTDSEFAALVECGNQAVSALVAALRDDRSEVRASAAYALGKIGSEAYAAVPMLTLKLTDPYMDVRILSVYALGQIGSKAEAAIPTITSLYRDSREEREVRDMAKQALSLIGTEEAIQVLNSPIESNAAESSNSNYDERVPACIFSPSSSSSCGDRGATSNQTVAAIQSHASANLPLVCQLPGIAAIFPRCRR